MLAMFLNSQSIKNMSTRPCKGHFVSLQEAIHWESPHPWESGSSTITMH